MTELGFDPSALEVGKAGYNPNQPRVPAGNGSESGRWEAIWNRIVSWLDEPVPEYDTDTGTEVGTRTRGRAIAANPLTVGVVGTAASLGGEAVVGGAAVEGVSIGTILPDGTVAGVDALGATPNLARLGAKFGFNADSEVGANILQNLNTPVKDFISQYRLGSIMPEFPSEHLDGTVGQALQRGGSKVRTLRSDSRFAK